MLTFHASDDNACAKLMGTQPSSNNTKTSLLTETTPLINISDNGSCTDTCSFYSGPSDDAILSFAESQETSSSVAYSNSETSGSIAFLGGSECSGSIAAAPVSSGASSVSSGGCSFSC